MRILRVIACVSVTAAVALSASSCGSSVSGTPTAAEIDVRTLDIGNYSPDPGDILYKYIPSLYFGRELAIMRLADKIANGDEIDPSLTYNVGASINEPKDKLSAEIAGPFISALEQNGMLYGIQMNKRQVEDDRPADGDKAVNITVYQFPDEKAATAATRSFEDADFAIAKDQNQPVQLDRYPNALSHWRPGIRTIGSRLAVGNYMLELFVRVPQPELADLTSFLQHVYDVQVPMLRSLPPLSKKEILHLPYDPDGMLRRAFAPKGVFGPNLSVAGFFTAHSAHNFTNPEGRSLMDIGRIDAAAVVSNTTMLWRSRDAAGAQVMFEEMRRRAKAPVDPPRDVPDAFCDQNPKEFSFVTDDRFRCFVRYGRYVARLSSSQIKDAQQRGAAQYAVLANSW
ncbi:DUF7373 family lipoprotein [Nocardia spumae]|uniref:DUF7373 family lipoprotein n=1 Tax=Nocardia spumae TaxID=2887190 RepID=UPI001D14EB7E|nr:hypothetical protein [Nocardia spumae]